MQYRIVLTFVLFCISFVSFAQMPLGKISGTVVDTKSKSPLEFATVVLRNMKDSSVTGGLTDDKGKFLIENIKPGMFTVEISFIGYVNYIKPSVKIVPPEMIIDLGSIEMAEDATQLQETVVTAEKQMLQLGAEKKVFNVDKNAISAGGTAFDALKQIPTVDVDMDGNINMRGSGNILILINGKPSGLTGNSKQAILESLPANSVESIEIISNPSAKYDADGTSGIINIVLKKNFNSGLNGNVNATYSTKFKNSVGLSLNNKKNKINFTSNFNFRFNESYFKGTNDRKNISPEFVNYINSDDYTRTYNYNYSLNLGIDYDINSKNTISFSNLANYNHGKNNTTTGVDFLNEQQTYYSGYERLAESRRKNFSNDFAVYYRKTFAQSSQEFNASLNYSYNDRNNPADYTQTDFDSLKLPVYMFPQREYNNATGFSHILIAQADYAHPFKKHGKLEVGAKVTFRDIYNKFYADSLNRSSGLTEVNNSLNNDYLYREDINAAYASFGGTHKKFSYKAGVRMEQSNIMIENSQVETTTERHYVDFFPSLFLTQKLPKNHELQFSYSRRINRPNPWQLNPFADFSNPLNIFKGNPDLMPEYIHSLEFTYVKSWGPAMLSATTYYRHASDNFSRIRYVDSVTAVSVVTWANIQSSQNVGEEFIFRVPITKWWNLTGNFNLYQNFQKGDILNGDNDLSTNSFQWNFRVQTGFKFWKNTDLQLSYRYNSKMEFLQGYIKPMHNMDIGIKKDLLKNRATLALNVQDIFNTRRFYVETGGSNFSGISDRRWETRIATLSFTYKFGKLDAQTSKRRNQQGGMDDSMMQQGL